MTTPQAEPTAPRKNRSNVRLPEQARRGVAEAERIIAELHAKPGETVDPAAPPAEPAPAPAPTPAPVAAAPTPDPAPAPAPAAVPTAPEKDYKQLYTVLKGKYDKEIPELRAENSELKEKVAGMETLVAQMADQRAPAAPAAAPASDISAKELEDYGPEFFKIVAREAQKIADKQMQPLRDQLAQLTQGAQREQRVTAERSRQAVISSLDEQVSDWQAQNSNPAFLAWLEEPDVFSGRTKRELLTEAFQANDAARVVRFFKAFQEDSARQPTAAARQPAVDPATLVAPGAPRQGAPAAAPGAEPVWTTAQVAEFYADVRRGKITGPDRVRIEKEILRAAAEGRVR